MYFISTQYMCKHICGVCKREKYYYVIITGEVFVRQSDTTEVTLTNHTE